MIAHLDTVMRGVTDPLISSHYVGFVAVAAVTVYELAIKDIFVEFSQKKHKVFGAYARSTFDRMNGRIKLSALRGEHIAKFGQRYKDRFDGKLELAEKVSLKANGTSLKSSYENVIVWRHSFAHAGVVPASATYNDVTSAYQNGKGVIDCLAQTMTR